MNPVAAWGLVSCTWVPSTAVAVPAHGGTQGSLSCRTVQKHQANKGLPARFLSHSSPSNLRVCP